MGYKTLILAFVVAYCAFSTMAMDIPEAVMNDPRFVTCMEEAGGPSDPNFMSVFAKCYSFVGRPRFGKRSRSARPWLDALESAYLYENRP